MPTVTIEFDHPDATPMKVQQIVLDALHEFASHRGCSLHGETNYEDHEIGVYVRNRYPEYSQDEYLEKFQQVKQRIQITRTAKINVE